MRPHPDVSILHLPIALLLSAFLAAGCQPSDVRSGGVEGGFTYFEGLGSISFPNSGTAEAQGPFLRGVLLLHSFEYEPAANAFKEAQTIDPDFALAYWGEAMTYNHPLWQQKDGDAAFEALGRFAATPVERAEMAGTERERMYLEAIDALYSEGTKGESDAAYADAMRRLHEAYPEDDEARAFYALAILGTTDGVRDFDVYAHAAETAQPLFESNPDHPGAAHYIIHSFDDPVHAEMGLPAARAYSKIAPDAGHAQHMTSHIFLAMGMWEDVVAANIRASSVQNTLQAELGRRPVVCGHYPAWLHYGHLMRHELAEAEVLMDACHARMSEQPTPAEENYFASMRASHVIDSENWEIGERWRASLLGNAESIQGPALTYAFTDAFAALRLGDPAPALALLDRASTADDWDRLHLEELRGLVALHDGDIEEGVEILRQAAATEDALPFEFGPPRVVKPTFELLGEELLKMGSGEEAAAAFQRAVERTPGRALSVRGLEETKTDPGG